jgi:hypothetical protein
VHPALRGDREDFRAMLGHDFFVRRHDVLTGAKRAHDVVVRGVLAAHHLDDEIDARVIEDVVGLQRNERRIDRPRLAGVLHQHTRQLEGSADAAGEEIALFQQGVGDSGADDAEAQKPDVQRFHANLS